MVKRFIQKLDKKSLRLSTKNDNDKVIRLAMLEESPDWCKANTAPTDWAWIQASNSLRKNNIDPLSSMAKQEIEQINKVYTIDFFISHYKEYENALNAAGLSHDIKETRVGRKRRKKKQIVQLVIFASGFVIAAALSSQHYSSMEVPSLLKKLPYFNILLNEDNNDGEKESNLNLMTEMQGTKNDENENVIDNDTSLYHRYHNKDRNTNNEQSLVKREEKMNTVNVKKHDIRSDKLAITKLLDEDKEVPITLETIELSIGDNTGGHKQRPRHQIVRQFYRFLQESLQDDAEIVLL